MKKTVSWIVSVLIVLFSLTACSFLDGKNGNAYLMVLPESGWHFYASVNKGS
jgi:hypothetical protein